MPVLTERGNGKTAEFLLPIHNKTATATVNGAPVPIASQGASWVTLASAPPADSYVAITYTPVPDTEGSGVIPFRTSNSPNVYGNAGIIDRLNADQELWNLWAFGDSRTNGIIAPKFVGLAPQGIPLGGVALPSNVNDSDGFTTATQDVPAGDTIPTSPYLGFVTDPLTYREFKTVAGTTSGNNALSVRLSYAGAPAGDTLLARLRDRAVRVRVIVRRSSAAWSRALTFPYTNTPTMPNVFLQVRPDGHTEFDDPDILRSNALPIYSPDVAEYAVAGVTVPAGIDWASYNPDIGYVSQENTTVATAGKVFSGSDPWIELPTGILLRETSCVPGRSLGALLTEEIISTGTFTKAIKAAGGNHALWVAIGTNNPNVQDSQQFQADIQTLIEKFREGVPDGPVIFTTNYAAQGDGNTPPYYVQALKNVAAIDRNVVVLDTWAALPKFAEGNALGYYGDDTHYNDLGQTAYANAYWTLWRQA